ncbi:MAG: hypothetical protein IJP48_05155 [Synergistaceae bacterium]|nr:hypothetical protein [Synergistaceae bacterium]
MRKKFLFLLTLIVIFIIIFSANSPLFARPLSSSRTRPKKFTGRYITNCTIYQLGGSEFVLKLYGRGLTEPLVDLDNDSMQITMLNTRFKSPKSINKSVNDVISATPVITDFKAENLSDDTAVITISSAKTVQVHSGTRTSDGYSMRIKTLEDSIAFTHFVPPPKLVPAPDYQIPFKVAKKMTLELRDVDLRDVLRMLMTEIGRNLIIDPSFPQNVLVTMSLNDVRVDEIFNYLLRTYDIACYSAGKNTTVFGSFEGLYKLSGNIETKTFEIAYADLAALKTMITGLTQVPDANIVADERMRTLHVRTNPAKMQEVSEIINRLDTPLRQVMIRASIFEFNDTATREVANALNVAYDEYQLQWASGGGTIQWTDPKLLTSITRTITNNFTNLLNTGQGKILADPSVIALDGKAAEIQLTEDYPYVSARDQYGNVTWATEEIGPKLKFTPKLGRDGFINLVIEMETGEVIGTSSGSNGEEMPRTSERKVKTEIRVRDGMPFVIGGLFRENKTDSILKIPVLGDIPLLGSLFKTTTKSRNKSQVVMIVTPYILDNK